MPLTAAMTMIIHISKIFPL